MVVQKVIKKAFSNINDFRVEGLRILNGFSSKGSKGNHDEVILKG